MAATVSLPWLWLVEALASFKHEDTSLLSDLIIRAPKFSDNLGKNAREAVSLRCLEGLCAPSIGITNDVPPTPYGFNLSQSCEDVLKRILPELSASNLRMVEPELLKSKVQPFVMHKRACLPKCALEQLKDTIVEGSHPFSALLREKSGLTIRKECDINALTLSGTENGNNGCLQKDSSNRNSLACKSGNIDRHLAGPSHEISMENCGDIHLSAKKSKKASFHASGPLNRNEDQLLLATEREECDAVKKRKFVVSSSRCTMDQDSCVWREEELCVKCNKEDGELLACSASICPLVVHDKCLNSPPSFDDSGNFYCPYCAYRLAVSDYRKAKKKAGSARKKLAAFMGTGNQH